MVGLGFGRKEMFVIVAWEIFCCDIIEDQNGGGGSAVTGNNSINVNKKCVKIMNDIFVNFIIYKHLIITSDKLQKKPAIYHFDSS